MKYIDTHCHLNFSTFRDNADQVIKRALNEGVGMILVGSEAKTSKRALELANKYLNGVWASVGLHPIHLQEGIAEENGETKYYPAEEYIPEIFEKMANFPKVVGIGEIGLDYYRLEVGRPELKEKQKKVFIEQLSLAAKLGKAAIIHCRQAHDDMIAVLNDFKNEYKNILPKNGSWGVMHCFSGDENLAWEYFNLGLSISFTGLITFSKQWDDLIRKMPSDKFMIETDAPFMTPEPYRGQCNEPLYVKYIAERIAQIRGVELDRIAYLSTENAKALFKI